MLENPKLGSFQNGREVLLNFSEISTRTHRIRTQTSSSAHLRQAGAIKRNLKYLRSARECGLYADQGRFLSTMWRESSGWMRRSLGLGNVHVHGHAHMTGVTVVSWWSPDCSSWQLPPNNPQTVRHADRWTDENNKMKSDVSFQLLIWSETEKKNHVMDLNYRGNVSIPV